LAKSSGEEGNSSRRYIDGLFWPVVGVDAGVLPPTVSTGDIHAATVGAPAEVLLSPRLVLAETDT
jgi:hypothetical protein